MASIRCRGDCDLAISEELHDEASSEKKRLEIIELLLCFAAFSLIFLLIVGPRRRRRRNVVLGPITVAVYTLSSSLILYTLALMQNARFPDEMFPLWAAFLMMVQLGGIDAFSTQSLGNNEGWKSFYAEVLQQCFAFGSLLALYAAKPKSKFFISLIIFQLLLWKVAERAQSLRSASKSALQEEFKVIADYMSKEHGDESSTPQVDPVSMKGYKYVVRGEEARQRSNEAKAPDYLTPLSATDQEVITVEKVWNCKGWLLSSDSGGGDPHGHLKDICLSFSLFKLLILKHAGYSMPRQAYEKTWRLIHQGLLSSSDGNGHERVFRVIELELAFLFDLFYTKYPVVLLPGFWKWKLFQFVIIPAILVATVPLLFSNYSEFFKEKYRYDPEELYDFRSKEEKLKLLKCCLQEFAGPDTALSVPYTYSRILITVMLMLTYVVVELSQLWSTYTSEWAQVIWLCNYVKNENWHGKRRFEKFLKAICRPRYRWDKKLGQYSLVQCFSYRPSKILHNRQTSLFYDRARNGQEETAPTTLTEEMKKEVIRSLPTNRDEQLRNGLSSLRRNRLHQLSWACNLETQTQVILVWHIATFICEHDEVISPRQLKEQQKENFDTATTLSKYLAYLVAFAPRMLPDHPCDTQHVFDQVVIEATRFFEGCKSLEQKIQKLRRDGDPRDKTIMGRAVQLGQQLVNQRSDPESNEMGDGGFIWKILAEFWAELALYVAPSDDVEVHLKHLALGGEFVTHLWALLYHAGIERAAPQSPSPGEDEGVQRAVAPSPPPGKDEGIQRAAPSPGEDEEEDGP